MLLPLGITAPRHERANLLGCDTLQLRLRSLIFSPTHSAHLPSTSLSPELLFLPILGVCSKEGFFLPNIILCRGPTEAARKKSVSGNWRETEDKDGEMGTKPCRFSTRNKNPRQSCGELNPNKSFQNTFHFVWSYFFKSNNNP